MKAKFLLAAMAILVVAMLAGCSTGGAVQGGTGSSAYYSSRQSENYSSLQDSTGDTGDDAADSQTETSEVTVMYITVNSNKLEVELAQNSSVDALVEILQEKDITYTATDYGNFEKVGDIGYSLPRNDEEITTQAGDVILYLGNNICLYYGTNTWSFTRIGKINGYTAEQLKSLLGAGSGSVQVTLSLK